LSDVDQHVVPLLIIAAVVYSAWWFLVDWLLPAAFNPAGSRLAVVAMFLATFALSLVSQTVHRHGATLYAVCAWTLTAHFYYLFDKNPTDQNWITGSYVTIVAIGITMESMRLLWGYALFVLVAAYIVMTRHAIGPVGLPGTATVVTLVLVSGYLRSRMDVERRLRAKAEADKLASEAAARAQMLFLSNINHELRTPLAAIMGFADLIKQDLTLDMEARDYAQRISLNGHALATMIEHILVLTEMGVESDQKLSPVDVKDVISTRLVKEGAALNERGVQWTLSVSEAVPSSIASDPSLFSYIFGTIIDNAVKFTRRGRIDVDISVSTDLPANLQIKVQDTGPGIPRHEWDSIFDPFSHAHTDQSKPQRGAGIGLTVARKLARSLGGDVRITQSTPGAGSTFLISLPLSPA